ncbi:sensor domain-containing diguanylate cyclase [Zobellella iuensis]|uniref:Sensor domain-containing diguanylate cyclase n=1 Tax=Zobellella iuensis TaxID=2803811 RepID=A0ABS1QRA4_9GAMM|nr:sensor domain-containing diguanylate cyclase [Zobellella iuensis]MBL1377375.1 sensor domain-containing diguanylate cyclase [Zobellella iuensis]
MQLPRYPDDEARRLQLLRDLAVLDTGPEEGFDALTRLAAEISGCRIALITLVDRQRQWFKSRHGLDVRQSPREISFCGHAILQRQPLVVQDAALDPRFRQSPLVARQSVRFYVGIPLLVQTGVSAVGTLCVADPDPRPQGLSELQLLQLATLAELVCERLRSRLIIRRLRESERVRNRQSQLLEAIKRASGIGFALLDQAGSIVELNEKVASILEQTAEALKGADPLALTLPAARTSVARMINSCLAQGLRVKGDWPLLDKQGALRIAGVNAERLWLDEQPYLFCVVTDKTQERLEETLRDTQAHTLREVTLENTLTEILASIGNAIVYHRPGARVLISHLTDNSLDTEYVSHPELARVALPPLNGTRPVFYGVEQTPFVRHDTATGAWWRFPVLSEDRWRILGDMWILPRQATRPSASEAAFLEALARVAGFAMERQDQWKALRERAEYDALTGLANRTLLGEQLAQALSTAAEHRRQVALLFIDLDDFKRVNDSHGHHAGDKVLTCLAERMSETLRKSDTIARLGGDEFVVVLPEVDLATAQRVAQKLLAVLRQPVRWEAAVLPVSLSIGLILSRPGELDEQALIQRADAAMYRAKQAGKNQLVVLPA